jgi:hypothetical protein
MRPTAIQLPASLAHTWPAFAWLYREPVGSIFVRRSWIGVARRMFLEALLTAWRAKVVGATLILALASSSLGINFHAANDIFCHDRFTSYLRLNAIDLFRPVMSLTHDRNS